MLIFQVATLAVYFYFLAALMGAQWVYPADGENYEKIYSLPLFATNGIKLVINCYEIKLFIKENSPKF